MNAIVVPGGHLQCMYIDKHFNDFVCIYAM